MGKKQRKKKCEKTGKTVTFEFETKKVGMPVQIRRTVGDGRCTEKDCPYKGCFYHYNGNGKEFNPFV